MTVVGDDGAPRAERTIVLWNPALQDAELGLRNSSLAEAAKLQAMFVERGLRTLTFAKSRKAAELIHRFTAERIGDDAHLSPYRAGYTAQERRTIERRLLDGDLLGVSATNALELGIDVGLLDAVISVGFPGTVASLRQQWGRAGRRGSGVAVLVASEDGLDQFFMREPDKLLGRRVEAAILDHANPRVLAGHVRAAAYEAPLGGGDAATWAWRPRGDDPELKETPAGFVWAGREHPAARIAFAPPIPMPSRSSTAPTGGVLGLVERSRAYTTVHEGAVYLHRGESYLVRELDLTTLHAVVEPFSGNWYTQAKEETMTSIVEPRRVEWRLGMELAFGEIEVTEQVVGYERRTVSGQERIELVPLVLPQTTFTTEAIWYLPEPDQLVGLEEMPRLLGTLHAAEHAMISLLPLWAMCDRWDIGGLSTNIHPQTGRPTVFIYDGHAGGVGLTERGFGQFEGWVRDTVELLAGCPCSDGCPSCVQSPKCGNLNDMLDKAGALTFLRRAVDFRAAVRRRVDSNEGGEREVRSPDLSSEEGPAAPADHEIYMELSERETTVGGAQLQPVATATTVRVRDGEALTTDGPFVETKEAFGGFYLIECRRPRRRARRSRRQSRPRATAARSRCRPLVETLTLEHVFRDEWGRVLANLIGFLGDFDLAEEAAQEAFAIAAERWPRDGNSRQPGRLADDDGPQPRDRPHPPRARRSPRRRSSLERAEAVEDDDGRDDVPRRAARAALHVLPPGARARRAGRADAAHARRPDDRRDRARVPRPGADDGAAARPREAQDQGGRASRSASRRRICCPTGSRRCSRSST